MKRFIFSLFALCLLALTTGGYLYIQQSSESAIIAQSTGDIAEQSMKKFEDKTQSFIGAYEYLMKMKANTETGRIDMKDIIKARQAADRLAENRLSKSSTINWEFMGPNDIGGRTRAVLIDKDNPKRMIIGGVSGGIFTSDNGGLLWEDHPQNTEFETLSISAIAQAPNGDIYVGTGENFDGRGYGEGIAGSSVLPGNGVYKSTDRGVTFQSLESTVPALTGSNFYNQDWSAIQDIEVSPTNSNLIYVATSFGVQVSQDGGATWSKPNGAPSTSVAYDLAIANDGTAHLVAGSRYYRADDGLNFKNTFTGVQPGQFETSAGNKVISMSPTDNNYLYIVTIGTGSNFGCLRKVWQSKNGGDTWIVLAEGDPTFFDPMRGGSQCQGWYDLCVTVDPLNKERIFLGGITLWSWSSRDSWNQLDGAQAPYNVHADKHTIVFHPTDPNIMYVGNDGGISRSLDAQNVFPTFAALNKNYNVTQFYAMAAGKDGRVMGGTQDNNTLFVTLDGSSALASEALVGGDGGFCDISKINPLAIFGESQNGAIVRTASATPPLSTFFDSQIDCAPTNPDGTCNPDGQMDGNPLFITPFILWEDVFAHIVSGAEESIFVTGACDGRVWMTEGALNFSEIPTWKQIGKFDANRCISAVAVSSNGKTVYAGTDDGRIMRITNLDREEPSTNEFLVSSGQYIASIDIDFNPAHIIVGLGNYGRPQNVMESNNATSVNPEFTSIQENLPLMPVYAVAIDPFTPTRILAGTEFGVWMYDALSKTWTEENGAMGRVPVHSLRFQQMGQVGCEVLYAGTHGRGIFRSTDFTLSSCPTDLNLPDYTDIEDFGETISEIKLYPNPMVQNSTLEITLTEITDLSLRIFDLQGRVVRDETLGELAPRTHQLNIEKGDLVAGTYVVMLHAGDKQVTKKLSVQ